MYKTETEGNATCAILLKKLTHASPHSSACERNKMNAPRGLAFCQENPTRRSRGKDSGNTNKPYIALARLNPAATQNGSRGLMLPSNPPSAGPTTKPAPKAAPNIPNLAAR